MPEARRADRAPARGAARARSTSRSTAGSTPRTSAPRHDAGATLLVAGSAIFGREDPAARLPPARPGSRVSHFERALELAERGRGKTGDHPARRRGRRARRRDRRRGLVRVRRSPPRRGRSRSQQAGDARARRDALRDARAVRAPRPHAALRDAIVAAGVARVVVGARDPNPVVAAAASSGCAPPGSRSSSLDELEARRQNEAWRIWKSLGRPFVTYKVAVTLDGRVTVPGRRWVSGEESRRRVHELRAASDAVAVGMGTVRADAPRLDARDVDAATQPRRLAFGRGPLPEGSELELRSGPLEDELRALAAEGVQSLLLEGGPTLATRVPRGRPRRQAAPLRRARARGRGPAPARRPAGAARAPPPRAQSRRARTSLLEAYLREP